jgi:hypothetical protein
VAKNLKNPTVSKTGRKWEFLIVWIPKNCAILEQNQKLRLKNIVIK